MSCMRVCLCVCVCVCVWGYALGVAGDFLSKVYAEPSLQALFKLRCTPPVACATQGGGAKQLWSEMSLLLSDVQASSVQAAVTTKLTQLDSCAHAPPHFAQLQHAPPLLAISIQRPRSQSDESVNLSKFPVPLQLQLHAKSGDHSYALASLVVFSGGLSSDGHYSAYTRVRRPPVGGFESGAFEWFSVNDDEVTQVPQEFALSHTGVTLILYARV